MKLCRALAILTLAISPATTRAQSVRGTVMTDVDGRAVVGAVVLLIDSAGAVAARSLTDAAGGYRLAASIAGTYRVRAMRIGYRPTLSAPFHLRSDADRVQEIRVAGLPLSLAAIAVHTRSSCHLGTDSTLGVFTIWEQARTALTAADLAARAAQMNVRLVTFERSLDRANQIQREEARLQTGTSSKPWASRSPDSLRVAGYVTPRNGWLEYVAPDLDVLLSPQFVEDHCFRAVATRDTALVGLMFEPTRDRSTLPEIRGTIWLDRATAELRHMEFGYTNVPRAPDAPEAGGEIVFVRMKDGVWAIQRWNIRMPVLVQEKLIPVGPIDRASTSPPMRLAETRVVGGELVLATLNADTLLVGSVRPLDGYVVDAESGTPLRDADVEVDGAGLRATTDSAGHFAFALLPGGYKLVVRRAARDTVERPRTFSIAFTGVEESPRLRVPRPRQTVSVALSAPRDSVSAPLSDSSRRAQMLTAVSVVESRPTIPEFDARRQLGIGHFLDREQLAKHEYRRLAEVLSTIPGLKIFRAPGGQAWVINGRGGHTSLRPDSFSRGMGARPACYVDVWLDGNPVFIGSKLVSMLFDVNTLIPSTLEGIEFYASSAQTPIKFARWDNQCGVLVLWSRRGP